MLPPKPRHNFAQEPVGIATVQTFAARTQQIWREPGTGDVGIKGNPGFVIAAGTGRRRAIGLDTVYLSG